LKKESKLPAEAFTFLSSVVICFIFKSGFNTPQLAAGDLKRLKMPVAESEKFRGKYPSSLL